MHLVPSFRRDIYLINVKELEFGKKIGSGAFGEVFIGKVGLVDGKRSHFFKWRGSEVAIKKVIREVDPKEISAFLEEARFMRYKLKNIDLSLIHFKSNSSSSKWYKKVSNLIMMISLVVQFIGLCETPLCILTQYCEGG